MALSDNQSWLKPKNLSTGGGGGANNNPTLSGDVNLGSNNADNISIIGKIDTALTPDQDNNFDIGSLTDRWANLYAVNGVFSTLSSNGDVTFGDNSTDNIVVNGSLDVNSPSTFGGDVTLETGSQFICVDFTPTRVLFVGASNEITENAELTFDPSGNFVVGQNTIEISSGNTSIAGTLSAGESVFSSASVSDLTSGRIVLAGTNGALEDNGNLTFDGAELSVTGSVAATSDISSGGELSGDSLNITNNATIGGNVGATNGYFTNLDAGDTTISNLVVTGNTTLGSDANDTTTIVGDVSQTGDFSITGDLTVSGTLTQNGSAITNQSTIVEFDDTILLLANNTNNNNNSLDVGFMWEKATGSFNGLVWDYDESHFAFFNTATEPTTGTVNISEYANIKIEDLVGASGTFSGNVVANTFSVGGGFGNTGLSVDTDGNLSTNGSISGTSVTTTDNTVASSGAGAIVSTGGISTGANLFVGTSIESGGDITSSGAGTFATGSFGGGYDPNNVSEGLSIDADGNLSTNGDILSDTITTTGNGDVGGDLSVGGNLSITGTFSPSSITLAGVLTSQIVYGGASQEFVGNAGLTWTNASNTLNATNLSVGTEATLASAIVSDLTNTRLVVAGLNGALGDSDQLTFDGTTFDIGGGSGNTGLSVEAANGNLTTDGSINGGSLSTTNNASVGGTLNVDSNTGSTNPTTGAVVVTGGVGIGGNLNVAGDMSATDGDFSGTLTAQNLTINGTFSPTNVSVGSLTQSHIVYGGASGALVGDASFTFDTLTGMTINNNISTENLAISQGVTEEFSELSSQSGTVTHNCDNGHIFYHNGLNGNITINLTNFSLAIGQATTITLVVDQGATPRTVSGIESDLSPLGTILWQGGVAPTGTANATDVFCFNIMRRNLNYVILGQMIEDFS